MTREEKIDAINELNRENKEILNVISAFDLNKPDNATYELTRYCFGSGYSVVIKDEILIKVIEMLKSKVDENNKKLDELLGEWNND